FINQQPLAYHDRSTNNNRIEFHNIVNDDLYLDEADFIPDYPNDARYNIHLTERLDPENGRLGPGATGTLHLACINQLDCLIAAGTLAPGSYNFRLDGRSVAGFIPNVTYRLTLTSGKLGIRLSMLVIAVE